MTKLLVLPATIAAMLLAMPFAVAQSPTPEPASEDAAVLAEPLETAPVEESSEMDFSAGPECVNGYATLGNGVIILCGERAGMNVAAASEPTLAADPLVIPEPAGETPMMEAGDAAASEQMEEGQPSQM